MAVPAAMTRLPATRRGPPRRRAAEHVAALGEDVGLDGAVHRGGREDAEAEDADEPGQAPGDAPGPGAAEQLDGAHGEERDVDDGAEGVEGPERPRRPPERRPGPQ